MNALGGGAGCMEELGGAKFAEPVLEDCMAGSCLGSSSGLNGVRELGNTV